MRKEYLITIIWVKFGYNYNDPDEFINYICEKCGKQYLKKHLRAKFDHDYEIFGSHAVMNYFLCELDGDLQEALVDYAINVWGKIGMNTKYDEYRSL